MIENGWLSEATAIASPHFNSRPDEEDISLLVIHNISLPPGVFGNQFVEAFFCGELDDSLHPYFKTLHGLRVSSHLYIKRDGCLIQFVPFHLRAWHAGQSSFNGRENCNDFSIGIELEGTDEAVYTEIQYERLITVTRDLLSHFPAITRQRIVGHNQIAPQRKTDPGKSFDWPRYLGNF